MGSKPRAGKPPFLSVFPAKAGTQTLSHRLKVARWTPAFAGTLRPVDEHPHSQPSPPQGGKGLWCLNRVIASAAKQSRGLTRTRCDVPLGCFGAMRLAMTQILSCGRHPKSPYPGCAGTSPRGGRFALFRASPSGGSGPKGRRGPCFLYRRPIRVPRESGDPDPYKQGGIDHLDPRLREERG